MQRGFTFIEILVAITLMLIMMAIGIASFDRFNDRQRVTEAALRVQNMMRSAQVKARAGDKPTGCTTLNSYRVVLTAGSATVTVSAVCSSPNAVISRETYTMPSGVVSDSSASIDFYVLRGGSNVANPITIRTTGNTWRYRFTAQTGGAIDEGGFE